MFLCSFFDPVLLSVTKKTADKQNSFAMLGHMSTKPKPDVEKSVPKPAPETGGRGGLDPVRYGDWEKDGRCVDF